MDFLEQETVSGIGIRWLKYVTEIFVVDFRNIRVKNLYMYKHDILTRHVLFPVCNWFHHETFGPLCEEFDNSDAYVGNSWSERFNFHSLNRLHLSALFSAAGAAAAYSDYISLLSDDSIDMQEVLQESLRLDTCIF